MRLAVVLAPNSITSPSMNLVGGEVRDALARLGFDVIVVDDDGDPVLGLERALAGIGIGDDVLVHASGRVAHGTTLAIDSSRSISIGAIAATIALLRPSNAAVVIDVAYGVDDEQQQQGALAAAEHVEALRDALDARARGQSALIAVKSESRSPDASMERSLLAFTRLFLNVAEEIAANGEARLGAIAEQLRSTPESHAAGQSFTLVQPDTDFVIALPNHARNAELPAIEPLLALADGARYREAWDQALAGYQAALMVAGESGDTRASIYGRIGAIERARGRVRLAQRAYEKALTTSPNDRPSLDALIAIATAANEWRRVADLSLIRAEGLDPAKRGDELFAIARMLVEKLRDIQGSADALEKARAIDPRREDVLHALRRAYKVLKLWPNVIDVTGALGDIALTKTERAARRFVQAQLSRDRLHDEDAALAFLEIALDEDPTHDEALDVLFEIRTGRGELEPLEETLGRLTTRLEDASEYERMADVNRRLGALRRERASQAMEAVPVSIDVFEEEPVSAEAAEEIEEIEAVEIREGEEIKEIEEISVAEAVPSIEAIAPMVEVVAIAAAVPIEPAIEISTSSEAVTEEAVAVRPPVEEMRAEASEDDDELSPATLEFKKPLEATLKMAEMLEATAPASKVMTTDGTGSHSFVSSGANASGPNASGPVSNVVLAPIDDESMLPELEAQAAEDSLEPETHARLFALHVRAGREDRAYLSALALEELGAAGPEHHDILERCRPDGLRLRAVLDEGAWHLLRNGEDDVLEALFTAIARPAIAAHSEDPRARRAYPALDPSRRQLETSTASIVRTFTWAARALDVTCPALYLMDDVPGDIAMVPAAEPSTVLGPGVLRGLSTRDLAFLAGRHLTYYRPEHAVLVHFPTLQELTVLVLAALQIALPAMPVPAAIAPVVSALRTRLTRHLTEKESAAMSAAVDRIDARGGRVGLPAWIRGVELTAQRVGLFLAGDLRAAMTRIRSEARAVAGVSIDTKRADLLAFCASPALAELRAEFAILTPATPSTTPSSEPRPPKSNRDLLAADYGSPEWTRAMAQGTGSDGPIPRGADSRP